MSPGNRYLALLSLFFAASAAADAGSISPGNWYEFGFDPNHSPLVSGCQPNDAIGVPCRPGIGVTNLDAAPWTFTSSTPVAFSITDGYLAGDFFDVLDFGALIGSTPAVPLFGGCGLDPRSCIADPGMSRATFLLPSGAHSITVVAHPAQILGEGFFQFTAVPEPSSFVLVAAGLYLLRRTRS